MGDENKIGNTALADTSGLDSLFRGNLSAVNPASYKVCATAC
jgi:hypothetical protein